MTKEEEKEIIRVCGENYDYWDIPAYILERDKTKEKALARERMLKMMAEQWRQEELERREEEGIEREYWDYLTDLKYEKGNSGN